MQGPHEVPKKRQRAGWACYQGGARYVDGLQGVKGRVCPMERQVCHGDRGIRNSLREGCVHYKVRGLEWEQRAVIPLTQSSLPTHLTAFVKPPVINSRQPGRTDQENGWGEATIHTALVVNGCRHLLGLLRTRVGEEFRMSCQSLSMIFPAALHRLNMVLLHLTLDLPSGCWLRACLKPETSHMPLICTPLRELGRRH